MRPRNLENSRSFGKEAMNSTNLTATLIHIDRDRIQSELIVHAVAYAVVVVLGLDDGNRDVGLVVEDVIGTLGFAPGHQFAADDDAPFGKSDFLADLLHAV